MQLIVKMARPGVAVVPLLFAALGQTQAGAVDALHPLFTVDLVILLACFVNATVLNDLADEPIDRVNLAGDRERPLVRGDASRGELLALGVVAGLVAAVGGWAVNPAVGTVVVAGLIFNAAYSLPPARISDRGVLATALLPAGYVAVPFLVGLFAVRPRLSTGDLLLLGVLYVGFMGRIVLKDFRDVVGDERYGKRTFLLRHGRGATCAFAAGCWTLGTVGILWLPPVGLTARALLLVYLSGVLFALRRLARPAGRAGDQAAAIAIAQMGRAAMVTVLAEMTVVHEGSTPAWRAIVLVLIAAVFLDLYRSVLPVPATRSRPGRDAVPNDERVGELVVQALPVAAPRRTTVSAAMHKMNPSTINANTRCHGDARSSR